MSTSRFQVCFVSYCSGGTSERGVGRGPRSPTQSSHAGGRAAQAPAGAAPSPGAAAAPAAPPAAPAVARTDTTPAPRRTTRIPVT